ncbi:MAG TPA: HAD-IIIC family phosphatase [Pedomonas sp.]|uniref:HAD-IIIC family phosphatase n=1 Tax=Pedomonas sp. TaxID=2976421 RepID=UPI002F42A62C
MFEFDKYERDKQTFRARPTTAYTPFEGGEKRAFLLWGEHCIECAAPDCYASCDLYHARPDMRCRRFDFGMFKNRNFPSSTGYGAEVIFRRWGKIEARGNATLMPSDRVRALEWMAGLLAPVVNGLGRVAHRVSGDIRWAYSSFALLERVNGFLHKRADAQPVPEAFVIELYNPMDRPVTLQLLMFIDRSRIGRTLRPDQLPTPVVRKLEVGPGYFREDLPREVFQTLIGSRLPFGIALTPLGEEGAHLVFLTLDFVEYRRAPAQVAENAAIEARKVPPAKCVVFDLDNTLWDGVLLEGDVQLRSGVLDVIRRLDERGILVSVASKNAPEDAMEKLRAFGLEEYVLFPSIGWGPKSEGLREIAKNLNIGIDALMFVDDNPFERDEVARSVPGMEVLPDSALLSLPDHPRLQGMATAESRMRRSLYRQAMERQVAAAAFGENYIEFLRSCGITVEIRPDRPEDLERVCELVQRTNQLNFSGRKYSRPEILELLAEPSRERYVIICADRYGSYGIVGFCLASRTEEGVRIDDFMLSCRVQGKFIEQALLHHLTHRPDWQAKFVEINFRRTERNGAAQAVLSKLGLAPEQDGYLRRALTPGEFALDFMTVSGSYAGDVAEAERLAG